MADKMDRQAVDTTQAAPANKEETFRANRRQFLRQALAVTSGIALSELLPSSLVVKATAQTPCAPGPALIQVGEITRNGAKLQAVIKVVNGYRGVPSPTGSRPMMLRYFDGQNPAKPNQQWPGRSTAAGPGPTLRCEVGDSVQITLLNQVDVSAFQGSLYSGEQGTASGCDEVTQVQPPGAGTPTDKNFYPANDQYPNCFHASSAMNMHFHGTHATPSTTGDNILVNIQPDTNMTADDARMIQQWFQQYIFDRGVAVRDWKSLPKAWRDYQMGPWPAAWKQGRRDSKQDFSKGLVGVYDATAPYQSGYGLPEKMRLWPKNEAVINGGYWPQYYVGSYPISFPIPKYNAAVNKMGQAPGTHWYHSHKHGSTSINLYNGLSGALIIEDNSPAGYDGALKAHYARQGQSLEQVVMVFQQITDTLGLMVSSPPATPTLVNGQLTPTITMRPGQVQLWRMINATVGAFITGQFQPCSGTVSLQCVQTAQDGVQFSRTNYKNQPLGNKGTDPISGPMAPANRIDLLVQAPTTTGMHVMQEVGSKTPILFVNVTNGPVSPQMQFPPELAFPDLPPFLRDIQASEILPDGKRTIKYNTLNPTRPGRLQPLWAIDGQQFDDDGDAGQKIKLNAVEEWTIINETSQVAHPFHIHVNPFQIIEVFDPNTMTTPLKLNPPFVWWDTFPIPTAKDGTAGYFKMRSRFVDFTGSFVHHCHILEHEDRGMMQLVRVCQDLNNCGKLPNISHH